MNTKNFLFFMASIIIASVAVMCGSGYSQEEQSSGKTAKTVKEIEGEVSGIGFNMISIVYNRDPEKGTAEELLLPIDEVSQLIHKNNIKEIQVGDTVSIQYDETTRETDNGPRTERKAKVISFIKSAPVQPESTESNEPNEPLEQ